MLSFKLRESFSFNSYLFQIPAILFFSFFLVDRIGRKPCLYYSICISFLGNFSFFTSLFVQDWMEAEDEDQIYKYWAAISLVISIIGYGIGIVAIPFVINAEYFPTKLRPFVFKEHNLIHESTN